MGNNISNLGNFKKLTHDLRKPNFIRKYLSAPDFKLLLLAFGVRKILTCEDLTYYYDSGYPNLNLYKYCDIQDFMYDVALNDTCDPKFFEFLHINGGILNEDLYYYSSGNIPLMNYFHENKSPIDVKAMINLSIEEHNINAVKFLHEKGYVYEETVFDKILEIRNKREWGIFNEDNGNEYENNYLSKFLFDIIEVNDYDFIFELALNHCDYYFIKEMLTRKYVLIKYEHYEILLESYDATLNENARWLAICDIYLKDFIKMLHEFEHENDYELNDNILTLLSSSGIIDCHQFLFELADDHCEVYNYIFRYISMENMEYIRFETGQWVNMDMLRSSIEEDKIELFDYLSEIYVYDIVNN